MANKLIKYSTNVTDLLNVEVPLETKSYKPVSHKEIIETTKENLEIYGYEILKESYLANDNGKQALGFYTIANQMDEDMALEIAWMNSYDKTRTLKFAIGTRVFICENGSVYGDKGAFKRKHTGDVKQINKENIQIFLEESSFIFNQMIEDKERWKQQQITRKTCAELLGRMYVEEDIIKETQMSIIKNEIKIPSYEYNADDSVWEMYNHCTHALKTIHPNLYMESHSQLYSFFKNIY